MQMHCLRSPIQQFPETAVIPNAVRLLHMFVTASFASLYAFDNNGMLPVHCAMLHQTHGGARLRRALQLMHPTTH